MFATIRAEAPRRGVADETTEAGGVAATVGFAGATAATVDCGR
jgi:hypothetical protein